jgi:3-dehydroquinate synthase
MRNLLLAEKEIVFVVDDVVLRLHNDLLVGIPEERIISFKATEESKSLVQCRNIISHLQSIGVKRSSIICGIGGGITTDLTAFVASVFKRGTRLWLIPTTVIAMSDAAVGGKTALNFDGNKNAIGSFYPAEKVFYNQEFLKTLPYTEKHNGLFELLKISFLDENVKIGREIFTEGL